MPLGVNSEPLFYVDLSEYSDYGFTDNEPIYLFLTLVQDGQTIGYINDSYEFVVRDGVLYSPYGNGFGFGMGTRTIHSTCFMYVSAYVDPFIAIPNAHGTAVEETADEDGNLVSEEIDFPLHTMPYEEYDKEYFKDTQLLAVRGLCGWPGEIDFVLDQENAIAYNVNIPSNFVQGADVFWIQDDESAQIFMDITPENTGNTILSKDVIKLQDANGNILAVYSDVNVSLDYNVWKDGLTGIKNLSIENVDAPAVYYNMQGMQIANPASGQLYIVKKGSNVSKQIVK